MSDRYIVGFARLVYCYYCLTDLSKLFCGTYNIDICMTIWHLLLTVFCPDKVKLMYQQHDVLMETVKMHCQKMYMMWWNKVLWEKKTKKHDINYCRIGKFLSLHEEGFQLPVSCQREEVMWIIDTFYVSNENLACKGLISQPLYDIEYDTTASVPYAKISRPGMKWQWNEISTEIDLRCDDGSK